MKRVTIASGRGGSFPTPTAGTLRERRSPSRLSSTRCTKAASAAAASVLDPSLPLHARLVPRIEGRRTCLLDRGGDRGFISQKLLSGGGHGPLDLGGGQAPAVVDPVGGADSQSPRDVVAVAALAL